MPRPRRCWCGNPLPKNNERYCSLTCTRSAKTFREVEEVMHDFHTPEEERQIQESVDKAFREGS